MPRRRLLLFHFDITPCRRHRLIAAIFATLRAIVGDAAMSFHSSPPHVLRSIRHGFRRARLYFAPSLFSCHYDIVMPSRCLRHYAMPLYCLLGSIPNIEILPSTFIWATDNDYISISTTLTMSSLRLITHWVVSLITQFTAYAIIACIGHWHRRHHAWLCRSYGLATTTPRQRVKIFWPFHAPLLRDWPFSFIISPVSITGLRYCHFTTPVIFKMVFFAFSAVCHALRQPSQMGSLPPPNRPGPPGHLHQPILPSTASRRLGLGRGYGAICWHNIMSVNHRRHHWGHDIITSMLLNSLGMFTNGPQMLEPSKDYRVRAF